MSVYRSAVPEFDRKLLLKRSDLKAYSYALGHIGLVLLSGLVTYASYLEGFYLTSIALLFFHGTIVSFMGWAGASHELNHSTVFTSKKVNAIFLHIFCWLTWNNPYIFKETHIAHHKNTLKSEHDPEIMKGARINWKTLFYMSTFNWPVFKVKVKYTFLNCCNNIQGYWVNKLIPESNSSARSKLKKFSLLLILGHLITAIIFIRLDLWPIIFLVNLASFFGNLIPGCLAYVQHSSKSWDVDDFRESCRSVALNPVISFLYWHMNYHTEHHMYPAVPCYNLKKLYQTIGGDLPKPTSGLWGVALIIRNDLQA